MQISVLKNGRELSPWAPGLAFVARENLQVVFDECEIHRFAADRCRRLPRQWQKVGECWNQFKVGSDIHLHRRHLLSLFRTYLVASRQKTCQELPGVKSMKKEEDWLWEHGASRQHVRFMMFYVVSVLSNLIWCYSGTVLAPESCICVAPMICTRLSIVRVRLSSFHGLQLKPLAVGPVLHKIHPLATWPKRILPPRDAYGIECPRGKACQWLILTKSVHSLEPWGATERKRTSSNNSNIFK